MTEADWLACEDPQKMLESFLGKASEGKRRYFVVACCRRIWHLPTHETSRESLQVAKAYADRLLSVEERQNAGSFRQSHSPQKNQGDDLRQIENFRPPYFKSQLAVEAFNLHYRFILGSLEPFRFLG
jgi:hypothetical protein